MSFLQVTEPKHYEQPSSNSISELRSKAYINVADTEVYGVKRWLNSVVSLYEQGDQAILRNDLEKAYVSYMRGCSIMVEVVRLHSGYKDICNDHIYVNLKKRTDSDIFPLLENLALTIETQHGYQHQHHASNHYQPLTTSSVILQQNTPASTQNRYSDNYNDPINTAAMDELAKHLANELEIPKNQQTIINLPRRSNNSLPTLSEVEPYDLARWITTKSLPSTILIIDIRPRNVFREGCIKHQWIIQLEPAVLLNQHKGSQIASQIHASLAKNPKPEQLLFKERRKFDLIVYYDQNSGQYNNEHTFTAEVLVIKKMLDEEASLGYIQRPPVMLAGGFDAWRSAIGDRGIYRFSRERPDMTEVVGTHISFPPEGIQRPTPQQSKRQQSRQQTWLDSNPFHGFSVTHPRTSNGSQCSSRSSSSHTQTSSYKSASTSYSLQCQQAQKPPSVEPTVSLSRPSALAQFHHHSSTNNIHTAVSPSASIIHSHPSSTSLITNGTTGLKNLGNTCYMNSIIQCLSGTIPLARYLISGKFKQHVNRKNKAGTGGVLVESFAALLRVMWSENYNFVSPMTFREALVRFAPQFSGTDQQDSQEFLMFLLDGLHEDLNQNSDNKAIKAAPNISSIHKSTSASTVADEAAAAKQAWDEYILTNTSIIVNLFQGQYKSKLTCLSCKYTSTTFNVFMSLSLPIPTKKLRISSITLQQCFDHFVREETLDKEDAWKCPKCARKRKALKQISLTKLPQILLIHLKRFSVTGLFKEKIDSTVKCPTRNLDLSGYLSPSCSAKDHSTSTYDLYAVSNHYGSLLGGHYTAFVRDGSEDKWHHFDDSRFSSCDESKVITKAAYNLFYINTSNSIAR